MRFGKTATDWEIPDEGSYTLRLTGIATERVHEPKKPGDPPDVSVNFQFVVDDPDSDWDGVEVRSWFPQKFTDGNMTGALFAAILGTKETPNDLGLDDLTGRPFTATIKHQVKDGRTYPKLVSPVAIRPKGAGRRKQLAATDAVVEDDTEPPF